MASLPDKIPEVNLPDTGGLLYETDDINIRINHVKPGEENELYFTLPMDVIGFPIGPPACIQRSFNSDVIKTENMRPNTMGFNEKGAQVFLRASEQQKYGAVDGYRVLVLGFSPLYRQAIEQELNTELLFPTEHNFLACPPAITLREFVLHFMDNNFPGGKFSAESFVNLAVVYMLDTLKSSAIKLVTRGTQLRAPALNNVLGYIEENLGENIGLSELSNIAATSPFHFSRCFKNAIGKPPYAYVLQRRIEKVKELLINSDAKLCDITLNCGFSSQSHLSSLFKKSTGLTPSQYRKNGSRRRL